MNRPTAHPLRPLAVAIAAALGAAALPAAPVLAAEPAAGKLGEVVVTARRVEERLQDTPISVTAFAAEDLEKLSIRNVADASAFTPNFVSNPGPTGGNDGFFFIRGVGQVDLNPATDPGVGTYIDGVYLGRIMGASFDSMDIARIEVLRGPQGTLFGRNTIGGAVNVTTADPSGEFAGRVQASVGSRNLKRAQGSLDLPLGEDAGLLISGLYRDQEGWGKRLRDGVTFGDARTRAARAKLKWGPSEAFTVTLAGDATKVDGTSQHQILIGFNTRPATPNIFNRVLSPLQVPIVPDIGNFVKTDWSRRFVNDSSVDPVYELDVAGASLTLDWDFGGFALKSITAYRQMEQFTRDDFDGSPFTFYDHSFITDQDQVSQELQLTGETGRVNWLVGAFFYDENNYHNNQISLGGNNGCAPPTFNPATGAPTVLPNLTYCTTLGIPYATPGVDRQIRNNQQFDLDTRAYAAFAHATIRVTDTLSASLGVRWTDEKKTQAYDFFTDNSAGVFSLAGIPRGVFPTLSPRNPNLRPGTPTTYEQSWSQVTPKFGVEWKAADQVLVYASYAKGFKSGGFNGRPNPVPVGTPPVAQFFPIPPYDPEKIDTYEVGLKSQFADDRVRLNVSGFWSQYEGIQLLGLDPASGFFVTLNAAESRIRGAEVELIARPVPRFEIQAGLGIMDNQYQRLNAGTVASGVGIDDKLPLTPDLNGSLGLQYILDLPNGSLTLRGDASVRSEIWFDSENDATARQGGYALYNARATYAFADERFTIAAYGLNLADKKYLTNVQDVVGPLGISFAAIGAPREWGLEFGWRF